MISVKNLYLKYIREYFALYDINMEIKKAERVSFVGKSNSGKTTMLRVLAKLEKITSGEVYIKNIALKNLSFETDLQVGYVPAKPIYLKKKTVYQNFVYTLKNRKFSEKEIEDKINKILIDFNIEKYRDEKFENLNIYEMYLISLARIKLRNLDLLLVDNIFEKLKNDQAENIIKILKEHFFSDKKLTTVFALSNDELAGRLSNRKIYFKNGSRVESLEEEIV